MLFLLLLSCATRSVTAVSTSSQPTHWQAQPLWYSHFDQDRLKYLGSPLPKQLQKFEASQEARLGHPWETDCLSEPTSQWSLRFAIVMPIAHPRNRERFLRQDKAILHCDLGVQWKSLAICDFESLFLSPKPLLSAGFLAIWRGQRGVR